MYIKKGAWKKAANLTMHMNILMLEWGLANILGHKSKKLNRMVRSNMEFLKREIYWSQIGIGL